MMNNRTGMLIGIAGALVIGGVFFIQDIGEDAIPVDTRAATVHASAVCALENSASVVLEARSAFVLNLNSGETLFEKEGFQQMPLASLTKLMTVLTAADVLEKNGAIIISKEALVPEGDSGLFVGEKWNMQDLIDFTLMTSSNDGAHALALVALNNASPAEHSFVALMNRRAADIGLYQTYFLNDTGLDISTTTGGAYGSARDVATLVSYAYRNAQPIFSASTEKEKTFISLSGFAHRAKNTSALNGTLSGEIIAKTGFTDLAGGNLAIIAEPILGMPVAIVVLNSSRNGRDNDVRLLYAYAKKTLKHSLLCKGVL